MDHQEFIRLVREYAATLLPDDEPEAFAIVMRRSGVQKFSIPVKTFADAHGGLRENELLVLSHLPESTKPGVKMSELMRRTGYVSKSHLYKILKQLRRKGAVICDEGNGFRKSK